MADQKPTLTLNIISQERELLSSECDSVTLMTSEGEVTILPGHLPLFSKLVHGELIYRQGSSNHSVAISEGFLDVNPQNEVNVIVDMATEARAISTAKAEAAIKAAHETMQQSDDARELMLAEASLKQAMLEIKIAQKTKKSQL